MKRIKQFFKQLFCKHEDQFVNFDPLFSVMNAKCMKCGSGKSYPVGRFPEEQKGKRI